MNTNHIATAFDMLVEEFERAITETNTKGADAFSRKDYTAVTTLAEAATRLNEYQSKVVALEEQWSADALSGAEPEKKQRRGKSHPTTPAAFHALCLQATEAKLRLTLKKQTRSSYVSADGATAVVCAVSRQHPGASAPFYWFSFHPYHADFLAKHKHGFLVLGCGSPETIFAIPFREFEPWCKKLNISERDETYYSHIHILAESGHFFIRLKGRGERVEITKFLIK